MALWARVVDGIVVEEPVELGEGDPAHFFPPDLPGLWVACADVVPRCHWRHSEAGFQAPEIGVSSDDVSAECRHRIVERVSETAQRNLTAFVVKLLKDSLVLGLSPSEEQKADLATTDAIYAWIGAMVARCRELSAAPVAEYRQDAQWPPFDPAWQLLIARF